MFHHKTFNLYESFPVGLVGCLNSLRRLTWVVVVEALNTDCGEEFVHRIVSPLMTSFNTFCEEVAFSISVLLSKSLKIKIYKTIILPVVLYGCEIWSLTLREESRLRVFENRILRRIFGPKRDENGEWRRQ